MTGTLRRMARWHCAHAGPVQPQQSNSSVIRKQGEIVSPSPVKSAPRTRLAASLAQIR